MRMTLSTRNLKGVVANLFAADRRAQRAITQLVRRYGVATHDLARALCPVDTGFMRSQLRLRMTEQGYGYEVGWDASDFDAAGLPFYPLFVEFGTSRMAARPSLFPAEQAIRPQFTAALRRAVREAVERRRAA